MTASGFPSADRHADPDQLADLVEGLLSETGAAAVRDHVDRCAQCTADLELIGGGLDLFADLEPEPIPAEVFARVAAALEREAPLVTAPHPAAARTAVPAAVPERKSRSLAWLKILAASTTVIVAGFFGVSALSTMGTSESKSATSSGSAAAAPNAAARPGSASDYADEAEIQQRAAQLLGGLPKAASGTTTAAAGGTAAPGPSTVPTRASAPVLPLSKTDEYASKSCWDTLAPGETLLTSESITYQGHPAELLVFQDLADPARAQVIVAGPACSAGTIVLRTTVAIPK